MIRGSKTPWFCVGIALVAGWCAGCACDPPVAEMRAFVLDEANQSCVDDDDCAVAYTGCAQLGFEYCGQVGLNKTAEQSSAWRELVNESDDCESECSQCLAALAVSCTEGRCFVP